MKTGLIALTTVALLSACGGGGDFKYAPGTASIQHVPGPEVKNTSGYEVVSKSDLEKRDFFGVSPVSQRLSPSIVMRALSVQGAETRRTADGFIVSVPDTTFFTHPSARINPGSMPYLTRLAAAMHKDPAAKLDIVAHYHYDGMNHKALSESQKRAVAIQGALLSRSIPVSRTRAIGAGDQNPVASNSDPVGQRENRRIEFHFKRG